jgi:hypothetical protein
MGHHHPGATTGFLEFDTHLGRGGVPVRQTQLCG